MEEEVERVEGERKDVREGIGKKEREKIREGKGKIRVEEEEIEKHRQARRNQGEKTAGGHKT